MQKSNIVPAFYFAISVSIMFSCTNAEVSQPVPNEIYDSMAYSRKIDVNDSLLYTTIKDYIQTYNVDPKKTMIAVELLGAGEREVVFIDQRFYELSDLAPYPSFFSDIEGHVVLIYSEIGKYIDKKIIKSEVSRYAKTLNIQLKTHLDRAYHPPIWKYIRCFEDYEIQKENIQLAVDYLPCGISLERDSSQTGYKVVKKE